jgi:hypothetical protein
MALIFSSCDMFSPRSVESPQGVIVFDDPLNLKTILNYSDKSFSSTATSYSDLLNPDFEFVAYNGQTVNRDDEIIRLKAIVAVDSTVSAVWDTCTNVSIIDAPPDTIIVCRNFKVVYKKTSDGSLVDSGEVQLTLEKYSNAWTIRKWEERSSLSIFNPYFNH